AGALDLLKELKNIPMTLELLQSTRIGMSVNAIRKQSTDEEVTSLTKSLIKSWKKLLDGPSTDKDPEEKKKDTAITSQNSLEAREESSSSGSVSSRKDETNARDTYVSSFPRAPSTSDSVRLKCREMLAAALRTGDKFNDYIAIGADEEELGSQIEEDILYMKYKNRVRSRISNLKDAKNPNLRKNVLCGNISPDLFARMTAEEMASDELKEMRKNLTKEAIREHQMAKTGGTQTDLFTCGKCKKKNCTYTQVQTRSADEPMTTFVVCNECGNRWKANMQIVPSGVRLPTVTCADHQGVARNKGRPGQQLAARGKKAPASSLKALVGTDQRPGLETLPVHEFCAPGL
ncbi:Transcription elongation factor A protein 1, partial [Myotis brandtii]